MRLEKSNIYTLISFALHACIVLLMCIQFSWQAPTALPGKQLEIVGAYLATAEPAVSPERKQSLSFQRKLESIVLKEKKTQPHPRRVRNKLERTNVKPQRMPKQTEQIAGDNQPVPALLALLHTAIQNAQRYPDSALEMQREGRTTLKFKLKTNGKIEGLKIIKSSGTLALDQAAFDAVNDATPFPQVDKFIHKAQEYQIDVVFKLS